MAFIIKPLITEKMTNITEKSSVDRTYKPKTGKHRGEEVTKKAQPKYGFIVSYFSVMLYVFFTFSNIIFWLLSFCRITLVSALLNLTHNNCASSEKCILRSSCYPRFKKLLIFFIFFPKIDHF